jgi:hypothetical protein
MKKDDGPTATIIARLPGCAVRELRQRRDGFNDGKEWRWLGYVLPPESP